MQAYQSVYDCLVILQQIEYTMFCFISKIKLAL